MSTPNTTEDWDMLTQSAIAELELLEDDSTTSFGEFVTSLFDESIENMNYDKNKSVEQESCIDLNPIPLDSMMEVDGEQAFVNGALTDSVESTHSQDSTETVKTCDSKSSIKSKQKAPKTTKPTRTTTRSFSKIKDPNGCTFQPRKKDILFGRGGHASYHPGNLILLEAVRMSRVQYKSLGRTEKDKVQKRAIVNDVTSLAISEGRRFLYREKKGDSWREASDRAIYEKICHMLRDKSSTTKEADVGVNL